MPVPSEIKNTVRFVVITSLYRNAPSLCWQLSKTKWRCKNNQTVHSVVRFFLSKSHINHLRICGFCYWSYQLALCIRHDNRFGVFQILLLMSLSNGFSRAYLSPVIACRPSANWLRNSVYQRPSLREAIQKLASRGLRRQRRHLCGGFVGCDAVQPVAADAQ